MTTYNGWTNYETWKVNLECFDGLDGYHDADTLQELAEDFYMHGVDNDFATGIIDSFLNEVNWDEIAEHYTEEEEA